MALQSKPEPVTLRTLAGGAAIERFDDALKRVLENILDPNTDASALRSVVLVVKFKPGNDRSIVAATVDCAAKLAAPSAYPTMMHIGESEDGPVAFEPETRQMTFDDYLAKPEATETDVRVAQLRKVGPQ